MQNCKVGDNCSIQPNTTISSDGFAFERAGNILELEKFPHCDKVVIENDVEIFANCSDNNSTDISKSSELDRDLILRPTQIFFYG